MSKSTSPRFSKKEVALVIASLLFALFVAEFIARASDLAPTVYRIQPGRKKTSLQISENQVLGYEFKENYRDIRPDSWESFSYINSFGLRDVERELPKHPNKKRVILLGDSVVMGLGMKELDETLSRQIEEKLGRKNFEVLNFGVPGFNTRQEVELLRTKGVQFKPDLVVLLFTENDFSDRSGNIWAYSFERPPGVNLLFIYSDLFRWLSLKFNLFHFRSEVDPKYQEEWNLAAVGLNNVNSGLSMLSKLKKEHGFDVLILAWPRFEATRIFYPDYLFAQEDKSKLRIEKLAHKYGFNVARTDTFLDKSFQEESANLEKSYNKLSYYSLDGMHLSAEGSRHAARALKPLILEAVATEKN